MNTDVRHRGKTFHIQTEDSGPKNPVLITHLFIGGNIIATHKSSYDELVQDGRADEEAVRERMRAQHKQMYEELMAGTHDAAARRRPRSDRFKDIPLARNKGKVPGAERAPGHTPPPGAAVEEPSEDVDMLDSVDLIPVEEEAPGRLEFPSDLAAGAPLDALLIAHLLDDA
ncbi:MAG: hypothetical protein KC613_01640 [Myxococcales bacterium]|nr:hypothetical protein [Myxococcales bacterium]MCB9522973.1 hypothetical protein [Myxococcales bacterium]